MTEREKDMSGGKQRVNSYLEVLNLIVYFKYYQRFKEMSESEYSLDQQASEEDYDID